MSSKQVPHSSNTTLCNGTDHSSFQPAVTFWSHFLDQLFPKVARNRRWVCEAKSSWNWCSSYTELANSRGKGRILLNLDESFIPYCSTDKRGNVASLSTAEQQLHAPPAQKISRAQMRLGLTLVGLIGQNRNIQRRHPHIMIIGATIVRSDSTA